MIKKMMNTEAIVLFCLIYGVMACGPGTSSKKHFKTVRTFRGDRIPAVSEHSEMASGKFVGVLSSDDEVLQKIITTDIIFTDPKYDAEARKAIEPCREALLKLASVTKIFWKGHYQLLVKEGYISEKKANHRKDSLHYSGRAFDLTIVKAPTQNNIQTKSANYFMLKNLAGLAYYNAKFSFVEIKKSHIHVSCPSSSLRPTNSRCFHGESFVRTYNGKTMKLKDIKVGNSVLTMNSMGYPVYSEVSMIMHQQKDMIVDDYVQITTNHGKIITLSAYHLIFISKTQSIFAKDVKVGKDVFIYDVSSNKLITSTVTNTSIVSKVGVYAPLTMAGTIIVDDVYASCYALFPSHSISHAVFWVWRTLYPYLKHTESFMKSNTEYHWYADMFRRSMNQINIFPYTM